LDDFKSISILLPQVLNVCGVQLNDEDLAMARNIGVQLPGEATGSWSQFYYVGLLFECYALKHGLTGVPAARN